MNTIWPGWALAAIPAGVTVAGLVWAVTSWRLSGPSLRVHCLAYGEVIVVRVFNAGRIPDTVEHVVLGGMRGGRGGFDLTPHLNLPLRLEPGQSHRWRLRAQAAEIEHLRRPIHRGWMSLWVLTGSMQQRRVEVLPVAGEAPPAVGWRLVPQRTHLARYTTALGAAVALIVATYATEPWSAWLLAITGFSVLLRALAAFGSVGTFQRQRVERWVFAAIWCASIVLFNRGVGRDGSAPVPNVDVALIVGAWVVAYLIGAPGAAAHTLDAGNAARRWGTRASRHIQLLSRRLGALARW